MAVITLQEAETQLSHWLNCAALGEEILIAKDGLTMAKLVSVPEMQSQPRTNRVPGLDTGKVWISEDFDDPLPEELLRERQVGPK
jgi:antitoxin (DNA-binding transcriptional repressor) of toxin-antitoxin stability system